MKIRHILTAKTISSAISLDDRTLSIEQLRRAVVRVAVHHSTAASAFNGGGEGFVGTVFTGRDSSLIFPSFLHWLKVLSDCHSTSSQNYLDFQKGLKHPFHRQVISAHKFLDAWAGNS